MKNNRFRFIIRPHIVVYGTVTYGYDTYGKLETITRGSTTYKLTYDTWNRPVSTKVGSTALSTNTYDSDFRLSTVAYGNGFSARYVYDDLDRVQQIYHTVSHTETLAYEMVYNGEGDLYEECQGDGSVDNFLKASTLKNNRMRFINLLCFVVRGKSRVQETTA